MCFVGQVLWIIHESARDDSKGHVRLFHQPVTASLGCAAVFLYTFCQIVGLLDACSMLTWNQERELHWQNGSTATFGDDNHVGYVEIGPK